MDELVRGLLWLCVCACGFCCWSKQAPNGTKPRGIELLLTTATCVSSPPLSALVFCLVLPYRWSYAFPSYYHSRVCAYVLSSLATFGKMATKAPTSFPSNSSAWIHKTWTFLYSYILQKSLNLSLQTTKNMMFSSEKRFLSIWRLAGFLPAYKKDGCSHHDAIPLVLDYWNLLISAKHQAKTRLVKRSNVSKNSNNTRQRWGTRWHMWKQSTYSVINICDWDQTHFLNWTVNTMNILTYESMGELDVWASFWHFGVSYFSCPVAAWSPRATGTEYRLGQV